MYYPYNKPPYHSYYVRRTKQDDGSTYVEVSPTQFEEWDGVAVFLFILFGFPLAMALVILMLLPFVWVCELFDMRVWQIGWWVAVGVWGVCEAFAVIACIAAIVKQVRDKRKNKK